MSFLIRSSRRFPVCCPVTYHCGLFEGYGTVWNLSLNGWRLSGDLPLRVGETCSMTVNLPNQQHVFVAGAIVHWARGQEYGVESLVVEKHTHVRLERQGQHATRKRKPLAPCQDLGDLVENG